MRPTRQWQVWVNGTLLFQSDDEEPARIAAITMTNTLVAIEQPYKKEYLKQEQGEYIRDIIQITTQR